MGDLFIYLGTTFIVRICKDEMVIFGNNYI